jgi:hypothetical protein
VSCRKETADSTRTFLVSQVVGTLLIMP